MVSSDSGRQEGGPGGLGTRAFVTKWAGLLQGESPTLFVACKGNHSQDLWMHGIDPQGLWNDACSQGHGEA